MEQQRTRKTSDTGNSRSRHMKMKLSYILFIIAFIFSSCITKEEIDNAISGNDNIVLNFSVKGSPMSKAEIDEPFESNVSHLDVFIYEKEGSNVDELYYYTRISTDSPEGTKVLSGVKLSDLKVSGKTYKFCVIANSSRPESDFAAVGQVYPAGVDTYSELSALLETTQYVNITGSTIFKDENGNNIAPQNFMMTWETNYRDLSSESESDLQLDVQLTRAAAKITFNFTIKDESSHIHSFGNPVDATIIEYENTDYIDLSKVGTKYNYSHGSYYLRNMTYASHYFGVQHSSNKRKTNPVPYTQGGYMQCNTNEVSVTVYTYSCSWGEGQSDAFTDTPFLIVNLPLVEIIANTQVTGEGGSTITSVGKYLERNYYEVPLRLRNSEEATISIERNHHYVLNAIIDAPGGITSMEPFPIVPVSYYVYPWNEESIDVGGDTEDVKYLNLSTNYIEMHNTTTDASIKYASSSDITVELKEAYYIDKFGIKRTISNAGSAQSSGGMNGYITVSSDLPTNDAAKYMVFTVSNGTTAHDKEFTVVQYPLLYIFNTLGYFSYRDDVKNNNGVVTHLHNRQSSVNANTTVYTDQWGNDAFGFRIAKAPNSSGASGIYNYVASSIPWLALGGEYLGWALRAWLVSGGSATYELDNGRMYHIIISSTSNDYILGKPSMDTNGYTIADEHNAKMVSPSFMIASQLGTLKSYSSLGLANGSNGYVDGNEYYKEAQKHCKNYVETYIVNDDGDNQLETNRGETLVELRGWRLPTEKEIDIIIQRQSNSEAMDVLLVGQYYFCASPDKYQPSNYTQSGSTSFSGYWTRCVRDAYDDKTPKH